MESRTLYDKIDDELIKGPENQLVDDRVFNIANDIYESEIYELFRFELSNFLNNQPDFKNNIQSIIDNNKFDKNTKKNNIKKLLYKYTNKELNKIFNNISKNPDHQGGANNNDPNSDSDSDSDNDTNDGADSNINYDNKKNIIMNNKVESTFVNLVPDNYLSKEVIIKNKISNNRELCRMNTDKHRCNANINCTFSGSTCKLALTKKKIILFINKVADELTSNELKSNEILQNDNYFVSDIVDPDRFKQRPNQKIIKSANMNIQKILTELFGKNNIPQIGKNRPNRSLNVQNIDNISYPLEKIGNKYIQLINNSNGIFRAYSNCFYWLKHVYSDVNFRNLGYYSPFQTDMMNVFKSFIIDYLLNKKRTNKMIRDLTYRSKNNGSEQFIINMNDDKISEYLEYFSRSIIPKYIGIIDLYALNQLHHIPIILYDIYDQPFIIIDNGFKYLKINNFIEIGDDNVVQTYVKDHSLFINIRYSVLNPTISSSIGNIYAFYFVN